MRYNINKEHEVGAVVKYIVIGSKGNMLPWLGDLVIRSKKLLQW